MIEVPNGWSARSLRTVATEVKGSILPRAGERYELWSVPAFAAGSPELIDGAEVASSKRPVCPDDVLICKINPRINRVWQVGPDLGHGQQIASPEWVAVRLSSGEVLPGFLRHYLSGPRFRDWIAGEVSSVTGSHTRAKPSLIMDQIIPFPGLREQRRIVAILEEHLSSLDAADRCLRDAERRADLLLQAALRSGLRGELVEDDLSEGTGADLVANHPAPMIGKGRSDAWTEARLGDLFEVAVGATPARGNAQLWGGGLAWVSSGEVAFTRIRATRETITREAAGNVATRIHPPGTVLLAMIGEGKTRGQAAILEVEAAHNQNCASIRVSRTEFLPEFVYFFLRERYLETRGSASGGNQPALNKARVQDIVMPVPPLGTQRRLVAAFEAQESAVARLSASIDHARGRSQALRRAVLAAAFSGRLSGRSSDGELVAELASADA